MKIQLVLFFSFFLICCNCFSQQQSDTNFIFRQITPIYNAIYIENNKNSIIYNVIKDKSSDTLYFDFYNDVIQRLEQAKKITRKCIKGIARDWRPLYLYNNIYYLYSPSDGGTDSWVYITDSTFVKNIFGDGAIPLAIESFQKNNSKSFQFRVRSSLGKEKMIHIHLIDQKNQIAIFQETDEQGMDKFSLKVAAHKINSFPIIVNYSPNGKADEFDFDKPDFKALLKRK